MKAVGVYKVHPKAILPLKATSKSACYDLCACLDDGIKIKFYDQNNDEHELIIDDQQVVLLPFHRYILPTGCKFLIPDGFSLRAHPRSGLSIKNGIILSNLEGVIDSDFHNPTMILISNVSGVSFTVSHGDRLAQIELVPVLDYYFEEINEDFGQITNRTGGLGSTGVGAR